MLNLNRTSLLVLAALLLTGCVNKRPTLYEWGSYEAQLYAMYSNPGKVSVEEQIQGLERDYQLARSANKSVPPGYHAHLGYLYFQSGNADRALQSFRTEKELYPESASYMDRLISQATHT